jgi:hypothetical protein
MKYILRCEKQHEFESWFSDSKEFDNLKRKNYLECIFCKSTKIEKSIMAPKVLNAKIKKNGNLPSKEQYKEFKENLLKARNFVEKNFEFVGDQLAKEVKNIYYNKNKKKNIYGTATEKEKKELKNEGIDLFSIPWVDKDN